MIDDDTRTFERRKLVKTYKKMCCLETCLKRLLKYAGRPTPKMMKRWNRKTATDVNDNPTN